MSVEIIINIIGWIATVAISVLGSYFLSKKTCKDAEEQFNLLNCKEEIRKAAELAEYYQKELLDPVGIILHMHKKKIRVRKLRCIPFESGQEIEFTKAEALKYCTDLTGCDSPFDVETKQAIKKFLPNMKIMGLCPYDLSDDQIESFYLLQVERVLNKLEFWCMYFNKEIADEAVVYQCLHQTFLSAVQLMYFDISYKNGEEIKDKYFGNIIEMFNRWNKMDVNNNDRIAEAKKEAEKEILDQSQFTYQNK